SRSLERFFERGKSRLVVGPLELCRAETTEGVDVVGIAVERGLERRGGHLVAAETEPTPTQTVVETFPRRLTPQRRLERDDGAAEVSEEILGPPEHRSGLVVLRIERRRLRELIARLPVFARLEQRVSPREAGLGLH